MKIAIVNKKTLESASIYEAAAPQQSSYGGPWGRPEEFSHIALGSMDPRAVTFTLNNGTIVATEDADLKAKFTHADIVASITVAIRKATDFGQDLITEFAVQNVMLGITADGKTGEVLDKMAPIIAALQSGSLYEAITRAKAINPSDYDTKYVTHDRLYAFINKIEAFLGLQLSL